jgi:hypothetical protein
VAADQRRERRYRSQATATADRLSPRTNAARTADATWECLPTVGSYHLWLSSITGKALWIDLKTESRADALWAADGLAAVCADEYDEFELWHGSTVLLNAETKDSRFSLKTGFEVSLTSQQSVLETEDALLRSHIALTRSRKLLDASAELRDAVTRRRRPSGYDLGLGSADMQRHRRPTYCLFFAPLSSGARRSNCLASSNDLLMGPVRLDWRMLIWAPQYGQYTLSSVTRVCKTFLNGLSHLGH